MSCSCRTKLLLDQSFYIVYDLVAWPKIPFRNFTLKHFLFGVTNVVKNSDKENYFYSGVPEGMLGVWVHSP